MKSKRLLLLLVPILFFTSCIYQRPDMEADMSVRTPRFQPDTSPVVLFDAGHSNFHNINSTYKPFANLLKNDGIILKAHQDLFTEEAIKDVDMLIIANAVGSEQQDGSMGSAFEDDEIHVLEDWVKQGGSLLLIADHDPFGSAASKLASAFGVGMKSVWTVDTLRINSDIGRNTWLEYTQENGGLGIHPILANDDPESSINRVITFTGQSLSFDSTWTSILQLSNSAQNYYTRTDAKIAALDSSKFFPVPGQSQLIACEYGKGRIVIAGEAAMFTAQEVRIFFKTIRAGFNIDGYDNKKFVLNVIHWLAFEID